MMKLASDSTTTNLFKYGEATYFAANFKNLFGNFLRLIIASGVDLLPYQFIGLVKNQDLAKKYIRKNFDPDLLGLGIISSIDPNFPEKSIIRMSFDNQMKDSDVKRGNMNKVINTLLTEYIHPDDEIYLVRFSINLKTHDYYVFVHPDSKRVVEKGNIFAFDIPVNYAQAKAGAF